MKIRKLTVRKTTLKKTFYLDYYYGTEKVASITVQEWSGTGTRKITKSIQKKTLFALLSKEQQRSFLDYGNYNGPFIT